MTKQTKYLNSNSTYFAKYTSEMSDEDNDCDEKDDR